MDLALCEPASNVSAMRLLLLCFAMAFLMGGCSLFHPKHVKSSTHIVEGDASSTHMQETQSAGGPLDTY